MSIQETPPVLLNLTLQVRMWMNPREISYRESLRLHKAWHLYNLIRTLQDVRMVGLSLLYL